MKKINLNDINSFNFYGCSHTQGHELIDHIVLNMSYQECNEYKKTNFESYIKEIRIKEPHLEFKEKQNSYAAHLANMIGKPFKNYAKRGNSLDFILFQILHNKTDDTIFIGMPPPERLVYFDEDNLIVNKQLKSLFEENKDYLILLDILTPYTCYQNYIKTIVLINSIRSNVIFCFNNFNLNIVVQNIKQPYLKNLFTKVITMVLEKNFIIDEQINSNYRHAFGHYTLEAHQEYALNISKYFINNE